MTDERSPIAGTIEQAIVLHPILPGGELAYMRGPEARLEEAIGLAQAIELDIIDAQVFGVARPRPATLIGAGKLADIGAQLDAYERRPGLVIMDCALSPVQHRNLEKEWRVKVLDRTALILEIFGARAQTAEGRLQVDLAHLTFQRSRLVRSWTHLERQRGGAGFLGGPGERQIEADRRALATRIDRLREKIEQVRRTRNLQRAQRKKAPYPVVALVGYTNAGKSTLFNRMTRSEVMAKDLLFATLDPTMRAVQLPSGERIILSDTVGFISDLPTQLVAAFRATLEEVLEADIIIHVRNAAHDDCEAQREDVISVLEELGVVADEPRAVIEVLNKIDLLDADDRPYCAPGAPAIEEISLERPWQIAASAVSGENTEQIFAAIDHLSTADRDICDIYLYDDFGAARAFLHQCGDVLDEQMSSDEAGAQRTHLTVRLSEKSRGQFQKAFPSAHLDTRIDRGGGAESVKRAETR